MFRKLTLFKCKIPTFYQHVIHDVLIRLKSERIHITSGYLTYVTLMSLVPLLVVMFSIMTAFPLFSDVKEALESFVYQNFVPTSGNVIREYLSSFVSNASKMSVVALSFLFLFAFLLMSAIDNALNHVWQVTKKRRFMLTFSMYWLVLSLGPILISISLALSSYLFSFVSGESIDNTSVGKGFLIFMPFLVSLLAFYFLYVAVPNKRVPIKYAFLGAFFAALLFEIAKKAFAFYVQQLPSYQAIYGTLSIVPILFLWMYLSWNIVLLGAVLTVSLQQQGIKFEGAASLKKKCRLKVP